MKVSSPRPLAGPNEVSLPRPLAGPIQVSLPRPLAGPNQVSLSRPLAGPIHVAVQPLCEGQSLRPVLPPLGDVHPDLFEVQTSNSSCYCCHQSSAVQREEGQAGSINSEVLRWKGLSDHEGEVHDRKKGQMEVSMDKSLDACACEVPIREEVLRQGHCVETCASPARLSSVSELPSEKPVMSQPQSSSRGTESLVEGSPVITVSPSDSPLRFPSEPPHLGEDPAEGRIYPFGSHCAHLQACSQPDMSTQASAGETTETCERGEIWSNWTVLSQPPCLSMRAHC